MFSFFFSFILCGLILFLFIFIEMFYCTWRYTHGKYLITNHHQFVTCLDEEDLVKLEKLKQVLTITLKLSIKNWILKINFSIWSGMAYSTIIYMYIYIYIYIYNHFQYTAFNSFLSNRHASVKTLKPILILLILILII